MKSRSTLLAVADDRDFPVRVCIRIPGRGLGTLLDDLTRWLDQEAGRGQWAWHSVGFGGDRAAIYLRRPEMGAALLAAFPGIELADRIDGREPPAPPIRAH